MARDEVLLYSGGVDSYCLAAMHQPRVLLTVDMGTRYSADELRALATPPGLEDRVVTESFTALGQWERADSIIPARNAHLCLLAAQYGDLVLLGATAGDRVTDKDHTFADRMTALLQHLYQPQWWLPDGRDPAVLLPLKHLSKREIVANYLRIGGDGAALARRTLSCYQPVHTPLGAIHHCGECKPCVRKWVALVVNGIDPEYDARAALEPYMRQIRAGTWDRGEQEAVDITEAWEATA